MQITEHSGSKFISLSPVGDLDANSSIEMEEKIKTGIDRGIYLFHIDCSGLRYISSAGLGIFISFNDSLLEHGGRIVFSGMTDKVFKVFEILYLHQLFTIVATKEEAEKLLGTALD